MKAGPALIALMAFVGIAMASGKAKAAARPTPRPLPGNDPYKVTRLPGKGTPSTSWTMAVGKRGDPGIAALLAEMGNMIVASGIPMVGWTPYDLTVMRKTDGPENDKSVAIPVRGLWRNMLPTLEIFVALRQMLGFPLIIRNGYRDKSYNAAVGGAARSTHQWNSALDISSNDVAERAALAEAAAMLYVDNPGDPIGFGVYGTEGAPGRTHLDFGWKRRTWDNAPYWVEEVT